MKFGFGSYDRVKVPPGLCLGLELYLLFRLLPCSCLEFSPDNASLGRQDDNIAWSGYYTQRLEFRTLYRISGFILNMEHHTPVFGVRIPCPQETAGLEG